MEDSGFPYYEWKRLGLVIGIIYTDLNAIKAEYNDPKDCLRECLALWLQQKYNTEKYGLPTLESLANAAQKMGLRAVSSGIKKGITVNNNYCIINLKCVCSSTITSK